jgi:hypothetical protein
MTANHKDGKWPRNQEESFKANLIRSTRGRTPARLSEKSRRDDLIRGAQLCEIQMVVTACLSMLSARRKALTASITTEQRVLEPIAMISDACIVPGRYQARELVVKAGYVPLGDNAGTAF